ncbi:hypothetical protein ABBQ38_013067 [Trebouxia sp. C0009 RCD-2024]
MGTRSWTRFYKKALATQKQRKLVSILYQQWDGYPEGVGRDLTDCIKAMSQTATAEDILKKYMAELSAAGLRHHLEHNSILADRNAMRERVEWVEWVYDVEEVEGVGVTVSIIPGSTIMEEHPWEIVEGTADEVSKWLDESEAQQFDILFNSKTRTIEKTRRGARQS